MNDGIDAYVANSLPRRDRAFDLARPAPPAGPPAFRSTEESVPREAVAPDMGDLATRVRNLMDLISGRLSSLPLGGRMFDVVATANGDAARAIVRLMDDVQVDGCGPVIDDPARSLLLWLVPPGSSEKWAPHQYGTCLGRPHQISLPPLDQTEPPGAYWLRPLQSDRLVPPNPLRDHLSNFRPTPAPHEVALAAQLAA